MLLKKVHHDRSSQDLNWVIHLYPHINIHTDSGRRPETIFGCSLCKTHPCNKLCFMQKFITFKKKCSFTHLNAIEHNLKKNEWRWQWLEEEEYGVSYSKWCHKSVVALPEKFSVFTKFW